MEEEKRYRILIVDDEMNVLRALSRSLRREPYDVETATSAALIDQVLDYRLDSAFVGGPVEHPELDVREISREELVLVHARDGYHPGLPLPLILFREGCVYRARALAWRRESGDQVSDVMELGTLDGILGCVAVGLGSTLMPGWVVEGSRYRKDLAVQPVDSQLATVPTVMVRHRNAQPLRALDTLCEAAIGIAGSIMY